MRVIAKEEVDKAARDGLVITIAGAPNRGKTTVARLIEEALRKEGFEAVFVDDPGDETPGKAPIEERVAAMKKRPIVIQTFQLKRHVANAG